MGYLTREQILGAQDLKRETVEVPEWDGSILVREMTVAEHVEFEQMVVAAGGVDRLSPDIIGHLAAWCIVGEDGQRLFSDADIAALGTKGTGPILQVFKVALRLSAFTPKDAEELRKNSKSSQSGDSGTD